MTHGVHGRRQRGFSTLRVLMAHAQAPGGGAVLKCRGQHAARWRGRRVVIDKTSLTLYSRATDCTPFT